MEAGKLDHFIRIERATTTKTLTGEKSRTWATLADKIPAGVEYPSSRQAMNSQQMQSEVDAVFMVRYRTDLTPTEDLRIVFASRTYRIKAVREIGRKVGLNIDCTTRAE